MADLYHYFVVIAPGPLIPPADGGDHDVLSIHLPLVEVHYPGRNLKEIFRMQPNRRYRVRMVEDGYVSWIGMCTDSEWMSYPLCGGEL